VPGRRRRPGLSRSRFEHCFGRHRCTIAAAELPIPTSWKISDKPRAWPARKDRPPSRDALADDALADEM
jgi:hypothetical protein